MSYRAVRHSTRKEIIRSASLKYLDAPTRSATRAGPETTIRTLLVKDDDDRLEITRAADELHS
eukprot:1581690-Pyramimonas_sp.AAC.1